MEPQAVMGDRIKVLLVLLAALVVHQSVLDDVRVADVRPDLMLLVAVAAGLVGGSERGAIVGFLAGLLTDIFLQTPLGLSALTFTLSAFVVGLLQSSIIRSAWWIAPLTGFCASAVAVLLYALLGAIIGRNQFVRPEVLIVAAVVAAFNAVLAPLVVKAMSWAMAAGSERSYAL